MRGKTDHLERYGGKGTWALVTGASDGIGLEFCMQLARQGFNIVLVSRSQDKLESVIAGDLSQFGVKTRIVVADFSQKTNMEFYNDILCKVSDLDIGLVVVNAGVMNHGGFEKIETEKLQQMLDVNVYQYAALAHMFGDLLEARMKDQAKRSGLVFLSSIAADMPGIKDNFVYAASKVYVKYLC